MFRNRLLLTLLVVCVGTVWVKDVRCAEPSRPNVVFLMADDLGYGDVGFNGSKVVRTPHMDAMAAEGIRFTRFFSIGPICSPTRASFQTGRHYMRFGMMDVNVGKLPRQEINLGRIAKATQYTTGHFGKWHLGTMSKQHTQVRGGPAGAAAGYGPPWERGYDVGFATETNVATWDPSDYTDLRIPKHSCTFWLNGKQVPGDHRGSSEKIIMDRALAFMKDAVKAKRPFMATIWFYGPHSPVRAGKELRDLYPDLPLGKQHYYGSITSIDDEIGRLRATLERLGVADNTLIFFCSDNGPEGTGNPPAEYSPYQGAWYGSAGPLRGRKRYLYNGGVCVPAFAWWPGVIRKGRAVEQPACVLDYVPTLNALTGFTMPDNRPIDGANLLPLLRGEADWQRDKPIPFASRLRNLFPEVALIDDDYKYCGRWHATEARDELYDLNKDPGERNNLAAAEPQRTAEMKAEVARWVESCRRSFQGGDYPAPYQPQGRILPPLQSDPDE